MSTVAQPIPEAAKLHIRISDSDDESDGEQQAAKVVVLENAALQPKESSDDLSQLARTAQAAAEAVIRVTDGTSIPAQTIVSGQEHQAGAGDNIGSTAVQQPQPTQVYYLPQAYPCASPSVYSFTTEQSGDQASTVSASQSIVQNYQNIQYQMPQIAGTQIPMANIPPGAVIYQMAPPQSPLPSSQIIYQIPTTPQMNCQTIMYQIPNVQYTQEIDNSSQMKVIPEDILESDPVETTSPRGPRSRRKLTIADFIRSSSPEMVYPTVYVSPAGLLTVLLKHDVAVEMTLDKTIRVVNHRHKAAAACNSKGTASCIFHSAAKVYQDSTTCDAECFVPNRQLSIATDSMTFAQGLDKCYQMNNKSYEFTLAYPSFRDLSQDMSVSLLFSSSQYGPQLMEVYQEVANSARYRKHRSGATTVYINGMKIHQYEQGDVTVHSGQRYVRVSPTYGSMMVGTHYVEILLENTHTLKVRRGDYRFKVTEDLMVMSDGYMECGMDKSFQVFCQLELLLVRTIIDNRQTCDISRTGSREAYINDQRRRPLLPMPTNNDQQRPFLPPTLAALRQMYDRNLGRQGGWWRKRGKSHYTIDLETAIRLCESERQAKDTKAIIAHASGDAGESNKRPEKKESNQLWSNMVISPDKAVKDEAVSKSGSYPDKQARKYAPDDKTSDSSEGSWRKQQRRGNSPNGRRDFSKETSHSQNKPGGKDPETGQANKVDNWRKRDVKGDGRKGERSPRSENRKDNKSNEKGEERPKEKRNGKKENGGEINVSKVPAIKTEKKLYDASKSAKERENDKQKKDKKKSEKPTSPREQAKSTETKAKNRSRKNSKKLKSPRETEESNEKRSPREPIGKEELRIKISPRGAGQKKKSPRDMKTPRGSKKRTPRDSKRQSPRDKLKERRNKKKRSTRRYTDTPEKLQAHSGDFEKAESVDATKDAQQQNKPDATAEELVKFAANIVQNVITEVVEIVKESEKSEQKAKETEEELEKVHNIEKDESMNEIKNTQQEKETEAEFAKFAANIVQNVITEAVEIVKEGEKSEQKAKETEEEPEKVHNIEKDESMNEITNTQQEKETEAELAEFAANIVQNVVSESVEIVAEIEKSKQKAKETEEELLQQRASTVLKHVFYIVSHKWRLYQSGAQSTRQNETEKKSGEKQIVGNESEEKVLIEKQNDAAVENEKSNIQDSVVSTEKIQDLPVDNSEQITSGECVATDQVKNELDLPVGPTNDSDTLNDETMTEEMVYQVVNTASADHLDTISHSKAPERRLSNSALTSKNSEPNFSLKESKTLRCTKSEVMTSSTGGSVKLSAGIETQNNSEGNITSSTANRLQATQKDLPELKVDVHTIDIATNEHGSGESCEPATRKIEAATSAEN